MTNRLESLKHTLYDKGFCGSRYVQHLFEKWYWWRNAMTSCICHLDI